MCHSPIHILSGLLGMEEVEGKGYKEVISLQKYRTNKVSPERVKEMGIKMCNRLLQAWALEPNFLG